MSNREIDHGVWEGHGYEDLEANCKYCNQPLYLVWEDPQTYRERQADGSIVNGRGRAAAWTECGGPGEGICNFRAGTCVECGEAGFAIALLHSETGKCMSCQG